MEHGLTQYLIIQVRPKPRPVRLTPRGQRASVLGMLGHDRREVDNERTNVKDREYRL